MNELHSLFGEAASADRGKQQVRARSPERGGNSGGVQVAGSFAGDEQNLTHVAA